jgi:hypothetical protein
MHTREWRVQDKPGTAVEPGTDTDKPGSESAASIQPRKSIAGNIGSYFRSLSAKRKRRKKERGDDPYIYPMF